MSGLRRAVLLASADRYVCMLISFALMVAVSRLLTPDEIGHATVGGAFMLALMSLREFTSPLYLVQRQTLSGSDVSSLVVLNIGLTVIVALAAVIAAPLIGPMLGVPEIGSYLQIVAIAVIVEAAVSARTALLQRDMNFAHLAAANVANVTVNMAVSVGLAALGFGALSLAWGWLAASFAYCCVICWSRPITEDSSGWGVGGWNASRFSELLRSSRRIFDFGSYHGVSAIVVRFGEQMPLLLAAHFFGVGQTGLLARALLIGQMADRVFAGVFQVALPGLATRARQNAGSTGADFVAATAMLTAVHWPMMALVILLAEPLVSLMLGAQWVSVGPLLQIVAGASIICGPALLCWPAMIAVGAVRQRLKVNAIVTTVSVVFFVAGAMFGLTGAVTGLMVASIVGLYVNISILMRFATFTWLQFGRALSMSAVVALVTLIGPVLVVQQGGGSAALSAGGLLLVVMLAGAGWFGGMVMTQHPLFGELMQIFGAAGGMDNLRWRDCLAGLQQSVRQRALSLVANVRRKT